MNAIINVEKFEQYNKKTMEKAMKWVNANTRMDKTSRYSEETEFHQYYTQDVTRNEKADTKFYLLREKIIEYREGILYQSHDPYTPLIDLPPDTDVDPMGFIMTDEEMFDTAWSRPEDSAIPEPDRGIKMYSKVEKKERIVNL